MNKKAVYFISCLFQTITKENILKQFCNNKIKLKRMFININLTKGQNI